MVAAKQAVTVTVTVTVRDEDDLPQALIVGVQPPEVLAKMTSKGETLTAQQD